MFANANANIAPDIAAVQSARMKSIVPMIAIAPLLLAAADASAQASPPVSKAGDAYEIISSYNTAEQTSDGSSASSRGSDIIVERVIAVRDGGLELEYDLREGAKPEERAHNWQLPARVFRPATGPIKLLNTAELEARLANWLRVAGWDRSVCGRWIFTWNAFRIGCDPQSIVKNIENIDLRSHDIREGASYKDAKARAPGVLARTAAGPGSGSFTATLVADPDAIHRARAETDVALGEIMREPVSLDAALLQRAKERVSGTIRVSFDADAAGEIRKRTKVTRLEIEKPDGTTQSQTATETVERRRAAPSAPRR